MKYNLIHFYKVFISIGIAIIVLSGCTVATKTLILYDAKFPAVIEPSKNINILKIDKQIVQVKPHKTDGAEYYKIALEPGKHALVVHLPKFGKGSIFYLKTFVIGGRKYLIKQKVGNRTSFLKSEWKTYVWVEDALTGEIVSSIIKNI